MRQLVKGSVTVYDEGTEFESVAVEGTVLGEVFEFEFATAPFKRIAAKAITAALRRLAK